MELKKNQQQCPYCKEVLTSIHNYDLKTCRCGYLTIDGGSNLRIITNEVFTKQPTEGSQSDEVDKPKMSGGK